MGFLVREWRMTAGVAPKQADLWRGTAALCEGRVGNQSIWAVLYREGDRRFGDELFADLFAEVGRRSVPPRIVATVMVLQRLQGLSDREAVEVCPGSRADVVSGTGSSVGSRASKGHSRAPPPFEGLSRSLSR
jgi:hypothetical protein